MLVVERWILARLRNRTFFSLGELNQHIAELIEYLNTRPFKKMPGSRRSRFLELEQAALHALPVRPYEFGAWKKSKVHSDYHIEVARCYYSVPYRLIGQIVDVRLTVHAVEIFHQGMLVATHTRAEGRAQRSTRRAHRPERHLAVIDRSLARLLDQAASIGVATRELIASQALQRKHPEETLRSAQGIVRLARDFSPAQLELACERALILKAYSYRAVRALIEMPDTPHAPAALDLPHENLRGADYFQ